MILKCNLKIAEYLGVTLNLNNGTQFFSVIITLNYKCTLIASYMKKKRHGTELTGSHVSLKVRPVHISKSKKKKKKKKKTSKVNTTRTNIFKNGQKGVIKTFRSF